MMGFGMMGGGGIFGILMLGLLIFLVMRLFNKSNEYNGNNGNYSRNALETLNERFAKGEISEEEYERKRKVLRD